MRPPRSAMLVALASLTALLTGVVAQSSASINLSRSVIGGGGGRSSAAGLAVHGTIGQSLTGVSTATAFRLSSGFWWPLAAPLPTGTGTALPPASPSPTAHSSSTVTAQPTGTRTPTAGATATASHTPIPGRTASPTSGSSPTPGAELHIWLPMVVRLSVVGPP
jgi:hypothetical protein